KKTTDQKVNAKIDKISNPKKSRQTCYHQEQDAEKNALAGATFAAAVIARNHAETRPRIIFAVHPSDGEEMRQLPQKNYRKQTPCPRADTSAHSRPADHRWTCARNCADRGVRSAGAL